MEKLKKEKVKVLFLIDTLETGGAERSIVEIIGSFTQINAIVVQLYPGSSLEDQLMFYKVPLFKLQISKKYGFNEAIQRIQPIVEEFEPHIIHSTLIRSDLVSRRLKKKFNIPIVNSFVSNSYSGSRYKNINWLRKVKLKAIEILDKKTVKNVDLFISNSHTIKADNSATLGIEPEKILVIPRGRDSSKFAISDREKNDFKIKMNWEHKDIIVTVGRLIESKGHNELIKAFSEVAGERDNLILVIAGEGPYRQNLEKLIINYKLEQKVFLLGNRIDIGEILAISKIFAFPSYLEGMPGSLVEAMMAKLPIICSAIPENIECLPNDGAMFFKNGDIKGLAEGLINIIDNYSLYEARAQKTFNHAVENFQIENIAEAYEKAYLRLLN